MFLTVAFLASCSKDKEETPLIVGSWKRTKIESRKGTATTWTLDARTCYKDDIEEFTKDGVYTLYDGTAQCSAGAGITRGKWKLESGQSKVVFTYDGYSGEYESTVESLTATDMVLSNSVGDTQNTQTRITYQKQ